MKTTRGLVGAVAIVRHSPYKPANDSETAETQGAARVCETILLGFDGGGSKSSARMTDSAGMLLAEVEAGPSNTRLGLDRVFAVIADCTERALAAAKLDRPVSSVSVAAGLAGLTMERERKRIAEHPHPFAEFVARSDAEIACLGAHHGGDGAILIVGTGSCGLLRRGDAFEQLGGWGFEVSDFGSGAIMGRRAVRMALLALEGCAERTYLAESILAEFDDDPERVVGWAETASPGDYAVFAGWTVDFAGRGDRLADEILAASVAEAELMVAGLMRIGATRIALTGGLASAYTARLKPKFGEVLVEPAGDSLDGALWLARETFMPVPGG